MAATSRWTILRLVSGQSGHAKYTGTSPIFVTAKLSDVQKLATAAAPDPFTGEPGNADATLIVRRLKVLSFTIRITKLEENIEYCQRRFANLVLERAGRLVDASKLVHRVIAALVVIIIAVFPLCCRYFAS